MLSKLIGEVDWPTALVLIGLFLGISSVIMMIVAKHKSQAEIEIEKMRLQNDHDSEQYKLETWRAAEMKKIEQNLITSHKAE